MRSLFYWPVFFGRIIIPQNLTLRAMLPHKHHKSTHKLTQQKNRQHNAGGKADKHTLFTQNIQSVLGCIEQ